MLLSPWLRSLKLGPLRTRRVHRRHMSRRRDLVMHSAKIAAAEPLEDRCLLSSISISDATVVEGNTGTTNAVFTVTVSPPSAQTVIVQFATTDGTANAGSDYQAVSGVVVFDPFQTTPETITVPVIGDTLDENNETFFVNLFNPTGDTIADGLGIGTIIDDDPRPTLNIGDATVVEGNAGTTVDAFFTVSLSESSLSPVTVNFATAGQSATQGVDFLGTSGTLNFAPGEVSKVIVVTAIGDNLDEDNETFRVNLAGATNAAIGDGLGIGTIIDDDPAPSLRIDNVTLAEGDFGVTNANFTVTLAPGSGRAVTVDFTTADGTATAGSDYAGTSGTLTFAPGGPTTQTITVPVIGDTLDEADRETFFVNLANAANATIADSQGIGTILDDDPVPALRINDVTVTEGDTGTINAFFTVTLSPFSGRTTTVNFATANGTATAGNDFVSTSGTLIFNPGETTKVITVPVIGDTIDEDTEAFFVNLSGAVNATLAANQGGDSQGIGTIVDNDNPPALSINNVTVIEGDTGVVNALFNVTLSSPSGKTVTTNFATRAGATAGATPATPGVDFASTSGTLVFTSGVTSQTIVVPVLADTLAEGREEFFVDLSNPTNAGIADGTGLGRIEDNDGGPALVIDDVTVLEPNAGSSTAVFTVTLLTGSAQTVTVDFATASGTAAAGLDFVNTTGRLTFAPGQTIQTISVAVLGDTIDEPDEVFVVNLSNAMNASIADTQGVGTIVDNDPGPAINISDASVSEGDSGLVNAFFTVTLTSPSTMPISVNFATTGQSATAFSDFVPQSGQLTFAPGETTKVIGVPVIGDTLDENDETFRVDLSNPTNATLGDARGIGTIIDDDGAPSLRINNVTVLEGDSGITNALFTVSLSAVSGKTVTANFSTADGTATAGSDYTPVAGTLVFAPGVTTQSVVVPVIGDILDEGLRETFFVNLSGATNATIADNQGTGTITDDDDVPTINIGDTQILEGNIGTSTAIFTVTLSASSALPVTVNFATANGSAQASSDYVANAGTLTFLPSETLKQVTVPVIGDTTAENDETFRVLLSGATNGMIGDNTGVGTIINDDPDPFVSIGDVAVIEGNTGVTNAVFTVSLSSPSEKTVTVGFNTSDGTATAGSDYGTTFGTVIFDPGQTTQTITVPVLGDTLVEPNETFFVNLSGATNATIADSQGRGTILDDDGARISINDVTVVEGNSGLTNAVFTVTLSAASPQPVSVAFATANGTAESGSDFLATSGTVTFNPGELSRTITVQVIGDNIVEPNETFTVNLANATGASIADNQGVGTILNDDPGPLPPPPRTISINDVSVVEGNSGFRNAVFTVTLSSVISQTVTVDFATASGTAVSGSDFLATSGTVTFNPGVTSRTITVQVIGDTIIEPNETFFVNLSNATNASIADNQAVGTIVNDDDGVTPPPTQTIERRVARGSDDAEEQSDGDVGDGSSDLELVREDSLQTVGIRFDDLNIPAGSTIHRAWIQFTADETDHESTSLTIEGESAANARTFREDDFNISSRARTSAQVHWNPAPWDDEGEAGPDQRTPDIASIVQEIVDQNTANGWQSGNALAIIITGTGKRVADSYNGNRDTAPLLHVEFTPPAVPVGVSQADGTQDSSASEEPAPDQLWAPALVPVQLSTGTGQADDQQAAAGGQEDPVSVVPAAQPDSDAFDSLLDGVLTV